MKITPTYSRRLAWALLVASLAPASLPAAIPDSVPYQGRVAVDGTNFSGTGQFKFAVYEHATGNFTPAVATATISGGFLTIVTVNSGGNGYSAGVTVTFSGGGGSGATATATVADGVITGVTVTSPGSGYTSSPTVVFNDPSAAAQLWNNTAGATTATLAEPATAVSLPVANGLYAAGLGDTTLANMAALPASLAPATGKRAFVRVWFNDGMHGFQPLSPDTELRSAPFAREAAVTRTFPGIAANATTASGTYATALGDHTTASGYGSTALGVWTSAHGVFSTALGLSTFAESYGETAIGYNNTYYPPVSTAGQAPADRLFVIGNGASDTERHDALTLYKNATFTVQGNGPIDYNTPAADATVPASGAGTRMMFLPGYGAFRAGTVVDSPSTTSIDESKAWDTANIGLSSTAFGYNSTASGFGSTAMGEGTTASDIDSTALGYYTTASGDFSTALGCRTTASGDISTAMGEGTTASNYASTAIGYCTNASGYYSTAMGEGTTASGYVSTAMGHYTTAESAYETVIGRYDTNAPQSSPHFWVATDRLFVIGNGTSTSARSDALIVFKNGNATLKGTLTQGSDRNRKTDIAATDTAAILAGVAALPVSTWKYKDETTTHLGPMAQDFAAAFHLGADETGIASVDADGVALAAIQELAKQNGALKSEVAELKARLAALEARLK